VRAFRSITLAYLLGGLVIAVILLSLFTSLYVSRKQDEASWRTQLTNLSLILAEQTRQEMASAYIILDSITDSVQQEGVSSAADLRVKLGTHSVFESMRDRIRGLPQIDVATVVAANGDVVNFTRSYPAPPINLADRDYFAAQLANPKLGVFISAPVRNKGNGKWTFYLSRRLTGAHGEFVGMCLVGMSSSFLSDFFRKISLGPGSSVTLYRRDFTQLARWPHSDALMGKQNRQGASFDIIERQHLHQGVQITHTPRLAEGNAEVVRMGAARIVEDYPLIVNVTVTDEVFLQRWRESARGAATVAGLSVVAVGMAFLLLIRALRRRDEEQLVTEQLKAAAESANRAKSEFLAMMSHEIRTPLTAIIGFAEMIGNTRDAVARSDGAQIIVRNGHHLLQVINEILDLSKIEAGRLRVQKSPFAPLEIVAGLETMMRTQATSKGITFGVEVHYPFPEKVLGDATRWKQILFNLCSNAIKFTELGSVRLILAFDQPSERLTCTVVDTGIGVPDTERDRLFLPFAQGDKAQLEKYGGTGLGLHLVKRLAQRILVAEDDGLLRGLLISLLRQLGYGNIVEASNGQRAYDLIRDTDERIELAFLDIEMPGFTGLELLTMMPGQRAPYCVIVSAHSAAENVMAAIKAGARGFVVKPYAARQINDILQQFEASSS
jgi:signal transduction histidine kinase/ActR/RegA family two-component response regulator